MDNTAIIGLDLAKRSFQLHGASADGSASFRRKLTREKLLTFLAGQSPASQLESRIGATSILITPGTPIAGIPRHHLKAGFEVAFIPQWKFGADWVLVSSQRLVGDEIGAITQLGGYGVVNLHTSYQVTKEVQVYALAQNLFNWQYYSGGILMQTPTATPTPYNNPLSLGAGMPLAVYGGVRISF